MNALSISLILSRRSLLSMTSEVNHNTGRLNTLWTSDHNHLLIRDHSDHSLFNIGKVTTTSIVLLLVLSLNDPTMRGLLHIAWIPVGLCTFIVHLWHVLFFYHYCTFDCMYVAFTLQTEELGLVTSIY